MRGLRRQFELHAAPINDDAFLASWEQLRTQDQRLGQSSFGSAKALREACLLKWPRAVAQQIRQLPAQTRAALALPRAAAEALLTAWVPGHPAVGNQHKPLVLPAGSWIPLWVGGGAAPTQALANRPDHSTVSLEHSVASRGFGGA